MCLSLVAVAVSALISLYRQFQMLQQNSYFPSRYFKWVKGSYTVELALEAIAFCGATLLYTQSKPIFVFIFSLLCIAVRLPIAIKQHKNSIKKLVVTGRVKRLYSAAVLSFALIIVLYMLLGETAGFVLRMLLFMFSLLTPITILVSWLLTLPIEKAFSRWYINDAKKILKGYNNLKVIGITGSYGKTTTKFILLRMLSERFNVVATPQSFNTPMGVVRTVRGDLKPQTQVFICEMGAKNVGDIKEICDIAHPDYGIITSVGAQHLETFRTVDNVYKTKFELADAVLKKGGEIFVNGSSREIAARLEETRENVRVYGMEDTHEYYAENITYGKNGSNFDLCLCGERINVTTKLLGIHSVNNIVAAAAVSHKLGLTAEEIRFAVATLKPAEHRLELKGGPGGSLLIDDAYNANPEGSIEAVNVLSSFDGMRKTIITPGLIELGDKEYECNYNLGLAAAEKCDDIIFVGTNRSKPLREAVESTDFDKTRLHIAASFAEALQIYTSYADKNSVVLLENDLPDNYLY